MILALVGPPGVGKTSLGESVARAMGRAFVRVALGGVRDEAEIRGHRRTYVGALPGRIVRAIKEAGTMNPVVLLDEVDKLGSDWRGDPSSALLEVLDPAQNHTFRDHYLDLDLGPVQRAVPGHRQHGRADPRTAATTAWRSSASTATPRTRRSPSPVTTCWPANRARPVCSTAKWWSTDDALRAIVSSYTREAGVRSLERQLARAAAQGGRQGRRGRSRDAAHCRRGRRRRMAGSAAPFLRGRPSAPPCPAWQPVWLLPASAATCSSSKPARRPGEAGLTITGQLGDVMQESAQIALSYVRSHAAALGLAADAFDHQRIHVHVPAGAIPKDGPSAGVTLTTALVSLLTGRPVRPEVGMTGEITLQGKVLPIGGVKQKVLAAHRAGLTEVVLPARNAADLDDVPEAVREQMTFHLAAEIGEVLESALKSEVLV